MQKLIALILFLLVVSCNRTQINKDIEPNIIIEPNQTYYIKRPNYVTNNYKLTDSNQYTKIKEWHELDDFKKILNDSEYNTLRKKYENNILPTFDSCRNSFTLELHYTIEKLSGATSYYYSYDDLRNLAKKSEEYIIKVENQSNFHCSNELRNYAKYRIRSIYEAIYKREIEREKAAKKEISRKTHINNLPESNKTYKDSDVTIRLLDAYLVDSSKDRTNSYFNREKPYIAVLINVDFINQEKINYAVNTYQIGGIYLFDNFNNHYNIQKIYPTIGDNPYKKPGYYPDTSEKFALRFSGKILKKAKFIKLIIPKERLGNKNSFTFEVPANIL